MKRCPCILLPYRGNPVDTVWLPHNRDAGGLRVSVRHSDMARSGEKKAKAMGLPAPEVLVLGAFQEVIALVVQVAPDQAPRGLVAVPVRKVLRDDLFGPIVQAIQACQAK